MFGDTQYCTEAAVAHSFLARYCARCFAHFFFLLVLPRCFGLLSRCLSSFLLCSSVTSFFPTSSLPVSFPASLPLSFMPRSLPLPRRPALLTRTTALLVLSCGFCSWLWRWKLWRSILFCSGWQRPRPAALFVSSCPPAPGQRVRLISAACRSFCSFVRFFVFRQFPLHRSHCLLRDTHTNSVGGCGHRGGSGAASAEAHRRYG